MKEEEGSVNRAPNVKREEEGGNVTEERQRQLEADNSERLVQRAESRITRKQKRLKEKRREKEAEMEREGREEGEVVQKVEGAGEQPSLTEEGGGEDGATKKQPQQAKQAPTKSRRKKNRRKERKKPALQQQQQQPGGNLTNPDQVEGPEAPVFPEGLVAGEGREKKGKGREQLKATVTELKFSELAARLRLQPELLRPTFGHPVLNQNKRKRPESLVNSTTPCPSTSSPSTVVTEGGGTNKKPRTNLTEAQSDKGGVLLVNPHFPREAVWLPPELVRSNLKGSKGKAYSSSPAVEKEPTSTKSTEEILPFVIEPTSTKSTEETFPIVIDSTGGLPVTSHVPGFEQEPLPAPTANLNGYGSNLLTPQLTMDEDFIPLSYKGEPPPELQPWFDPSCYSVTLSPAQRLQGEMEAVVQYLSPTEEEIKLRQWVFSQVRTAAKALWPTATVHMFGSFRTKLFIPTSDVDIVIIIPELAQAELVSCLTSFHSDLSSTLQFARSEIRRNAKVPIINFVESVTGLEVDININAASGIDSCRIVTQFIDQCPAVRPLNMVLKHFLELHDLNKVFTGGLSSYALTLLVVNFLQVHPLVRTGQLDPMKNLGLLLVEFLELYGVCFNSTLVGITLTNGGRYYQRSNLTLSWNTTLNCSLELLDPQDESNNVTQGSFNYFHVKTAFRCAFIDLTTTIRHYCRASRAGYPRPLLGAMLHIPPATLALRARLHDAYCHLFTT